MVITGASSGLGAACAKVFHSIGCKLVLCGRNVDTLQQVVTLVQEMLVTTDSLASKERDRSKIVH